MPSTLFHFHDADLILRSGCTFEGALDCTKTVDFHIHRCVLSAASPFFEGMLTLPQPPTTSTEALPVVPMSESAAVVETLLAYIYPMHDPVVSSLEEIVPVLEAAQKYELVAATSGLRRQLTNAIFLKMYPLRVYAIASRFDLDEEAVIAAKATLSVGLHDLSLHEDLKGTTAYAYHRLFLFHQRRSRDTIALLTLPNDIKCMQCNGRRDRMNEPPLWWIEWEARAREELRLRPVPQTVCSIGFLQKAAQVGGCERCAGCILASFWFFDQLKRDMDALPMTL